MHEPVWVIGTGLTASNEQAGLAHKVIRSELAKKYENAEKVQILYGIQKPAILWPFRARKYRCGLVGGASLKPTDFAEMVKISAEFKLS